jgi:diguanylate cyclase (GGDEF)-like protein
MTSRSTTTSDRRSAAGEDSRSGGRSVAERAFGHIRLLAAVLLALGGAGYRPTGAGALDRTVAMVLAGSAAVLLLAVAVLTARAAKAGAGRRSKLALASTLADATVVLGVVWLAGLPPTSFALVLLMLPLLEAALWFGLTGLAALWTLCSVVAGGYVVAFPARVADDALGILVIAMPTLLLATMPVAMLAEHLVAQVGRLRSAREAADDRARLLGDLSAISAEIFPLDVEAVLAQLVHGAEQLGATGAAVLDVAGRSRAGGPGSGAGTLPESPEASVAVGTAQDVPVSRELEVPGGEPFTFTARVAGPADEVARRVEAVHLLLAQAQVGLANAVLVKQLETLKETYELQATRDQLTGLLNRRGLVVRAEQLPGHLGVLFCDLDGFKGVNDTLGHAAGDELLEKVAVRLEREMRDDSVLGRMGGDEFVVVVPGASDDDLAAIGRRLEIAIGRPFLLEAGMARIGVSIGSAHAAPGERDLDSLLGKADQLMYEVKRNRKAQQAAGGLPDAVGSPR